jgi:hypothetical protein
MSLVALASLETARVAAAQQVYCPDFVAISSPGFNPAAIWFGGALA